MNIQAKCLEKLLRVWFCQRLIIWQNWCDPLIPIPLNPTHFLQSHGWILNPCSIIHLEYKNSEEEDFVFCLPSCIFFLFSVATINHQVNASASAFCGHLRSSRSSVEVAYIEIHLSFYLIWSVRWKTSPAIYHAVGANKCHFPNLATSHCGSLFKRHVMLSMRPAEAHFWSVTEL